MRLFKLERILLMKTKRNIFLQSVCMATIFVTSLCSIVGCGDGRPECFPFKGKVLIDDKPLPCGTIRVIPQNARPAIGIIQPDGSFTLKTFEGGDGVVAGTHPVAILAVEQLGSNKQKWHAPKKYAMPETSGLTITVNASNDSVLPIQLTWDGGKPFIEVLEE